MLNFAAQRTLKDMKKSDAIETLNDIKEMMERSSKFKAISGLSIIIIGVLASLAAAYIHFFIGDYTIDTPHKMRITVIIAVSLLVVSFLTVMLMSWAKAKRLQLRFTLDSTLKRLLINFFVPLCAGGLFCIALIMQQHYGLTSSVMLIFYGLALINSQQYTYKILKYLGYAELVLGLIDCFLVNYALLTWFIGFGVLHIVFGIIFIIKYGKGGKS